MFYSSNHKEEKKPTAYSISALRGHVVTLSPGVIKWLQLEYSLIKVGNGASVRKSTLCSWDWGHAQPGLFFWGRICHVKPCGIPSLLSDQSFISFPLPCRVAHMQEELGTSLSCKGPQGSLAPLLRVESSTGIPLFCYPTGNNSFPASEPKRDPNKIPHLRNTQDQSGVP